MFFNFRLQLNQFFYLIAAPMCIAQLRLKLILSRLLPLKMISLELVLKT